MVGRCYSDNFTVLKKRFSIEDFIRRSITFRRTTDLNIARCRLPSGRVRQQSQPATAVKRGGLYASARTARDDERELAETATAKWLMPGNMEMLWKRALGSGAFHVLAARAHVETIPRFRDRVTVVENRICGFTRPLLALQNVGHSSGPHDEASQGLGLGLASQLASCSGTLIEKNGSSRKWHPANANSNFLLNEKRTQGAMHLNADLLFVDQDAPLSCLLRIDKGKFMKTKYVYISI